MEEHGEWFRESLKKIEFLYKLCGLRLYSTETSIVKIRSVFLFTFLNLNSELVATTSYFIDGLTTGKDFITLTYTAPCVLFSYMSNFKVLLVLYEESLRHKLIDQIIEIEEKSKKYISLVDRKEIVGNDVKFLHGLMKLQNAMNLIMILGFFIAPMSFITVKYFKTREIELILPLFGIYPFDALDRRIWPLVYIHQIFVSALVLLYALAVDTFLYICCTYINIQFKLLQHEIQRAISLKNKNSLHSSRLDFQEKLKEILEWHQDLIRSAEMLESIYAKSTLFNFVSSSASICLTLFNVTVIKDIAYVITFVSFLGMVLLQIFFLCYFGDMISKSSMEVSDAVYHSLWYLLDSPVGKQLLFIMISSQKPCKLTANGFADINLKAFMKILGNAWSYFALLKTIYN